MNVKDLSPDEHRDRARSESDRIRQHELCEISLQVGLEGHHPGGHFLEALLSHGQFENVRVRFDHLPSDPGKIADEGPSLEQAGFQSLGPVVVEQVMGEVGHDQAGNDSQAQMEPIELARKDDPIQKKKKKIGPSSWQKDFGNGNCSIIKKMNLTIISMNYFKV